jgi:hypothetical protein
MDFAGTPKSKLAQQQRNLGDFVKDKSRVRPAAGWLR